MPYPNASQRDAIYAGLIQGTALDHPQAGPYGVDCVCDIWSPCDQCRAREQREFDQNTAGLVQFSVIERNR